MNGAIGKRGRPKSWMEVINKKMLILHDIEMPFNKAEWKKRILVIDTKI